MRGRQEVKKYIGYLQSYFDIINHEVPELLVRIDRMASSKTTMPLLLPYQDVPDIPS
jgi:hypothetical protein